MVDSPYPEYNIFVVSLAGNSFDLPVPYNGPHSFAVSNVSTGEIVRVVKVEGNEPIVWDSPLGPLKFEVCDSRKYYNTNKKEVLYYKITTDSGGDRYCQDERFDLFIRGRDPLIINGSYYPMFFIGRSSLVIEFGHSRVYDQIYDQYWDYLLLNKSMDDVCDLGYGYSVSDYFYYVYYDAGDPVIDCLENCTWTFCGDDIVENPNHYGYNETCDGSETLISGYYFLDTTENCRDDCTYCGDGILQSDYEECDPRDDITSLPERYICTETCELEYVVNECRDTIVETAEGETCEFDLPDLPVVNNWYWFDGMIFNYPVSGVHGECNTDLCVFCGDNMTQPLNDETCDTDVYSFGSLRSGECHSTECIYCGDGVTQSINNETCDTLSDTGPYDSECRDSCTFCGDLIVQLVDDEECEIGVDGYTIETCTEDCIIYDPQCGDNETDLDEGETCDDLYGVGLDNYYLLPSGVINTEGTGCREGVCTYCGDNRIDAGYDETCDTDNILSASFPFLNDEECRDDCTYCGDDFVNEEHGETCDLYTVFDDSYSFLNMEEWCRDDCTYCGDTIWQVGDEDCDPTAPGWDAGNCSAMCVEVETNCNPDEMTSNVSFLTPNFYLLADGSLNGEIINNGDNAITFGVGQGWCSSTLSFSSLCSDTGPAPFPIPGANPLLPSSSISTGILSGMVGNWEIGPGDCNEGGYLVFEYHTSSDDECHLGYVELCGGHCGDDVTNNANDETCDGDDGDYTLFVPSMGYVIGSIVDPHGDCRDDCTYCGDNVIDNITNDETCDGANYLVGLPFLNDERCRDDEYDHPCTYCGDNITDLSYSETCDRNISLSPYGNDCRDDCHYCGDGEVQVDDEDCEIGVGGYTDYNCSEMCREIAPGCGDGTTNIGLGETCDDPDDYDDYYYNNGISYLLRTVSPPYEDCRIGDCHYCGDNITQFGEGEYCDWDTFENPLHSTEDYDCRDDCTYCGDGIIQVGDPYYEDCDPEAPGWDYDNCSMKCEYIPTICGNEIIEQPNDDALNETCEVGLDDAENWYWFDGVTFNNTVTWMHSEECRNCTYCGDNLIQPEHDETCDHNMFGIGGHTTSDYWCRPTQCSYCGDEILNVAEGETCELDMGGCRNYSVYIDEACTYCGDGEVQPRFANESCDGTAFDDLGGYPLLSDYEGCRDDCHYCGDGTVEFGIEACDPSADGWSLDNCTVNCTYKLCGDHDLDEGETCDPPNIRLPISPFNTNLMPPNDNPCRRTCTYCGDEIVQSLEGESCDDSNRNNNDDCLNDCEWSYCGDGYLQMPNYYDVFETCDGSERVPGFPFMNDEECRDDCTYCGDSVINNLTLRKVMVKDSDRVEDSISSEGLGRRTHDEYYVYLPVEICDPAFDEECRDDCSWCGDAMVQTDYNETCDPYADGSIDCRDDCTYCGDSILDGYYERGGWSIPYPIRVKPNDDKGSSNLIGRIKNNFFTKLFTLIWVGEYCDPGMDPGCRDDCTGCGDGVIQEEWGEECDPEDPSTGSECTEYCKIEAPGVKYCGDNVTTSPNNFDQNETCDPPGYPFGMLGNLCRDDCTGCGDGLIDSRWGETCDLETIADGHGEFTHSEERCRDDCHFCGDGIVQGDYEDCEIGFGGYTSYNCSFNCEKIASECGDGVTNTVMGETCDPYDDYYYHNGFDYLLRPEVPEYESCRDDDCHYCGDNITQSDEGEYCDWETFSNLLHTIDNYECRKDCTYCGDGEVQPEFEDCDPLDDPNCGPDCEYCEGRLQFETPVRLFRHILDRDAEFYHINTTLHFEYQMILYSTPEHVVVGNPECLEDGDVLTSNTINTGAIYDLSWVTPMEVVSSSFGTSSHDESLFDGTEVRTGDIIWIDADELEDLTIIARSDSSHLIPSDYSAYGLTDIPNDASPVQWVEFYTISYPMHTSLHAKGYSAMLCSAKINIFVDDAIVYSDDLIDMPSTIELGSGSGTYDVNIKYQDIECVGVISSDLSDTGTKGLFYLSDESITEFVEFEVFNGELTVE